MKQLKFDARIDKPLYTINNVRTSKSELKGPRFIDWFDKEYGLKEIKLEK